MSASDTEADPEARRLLTLLAAEHEGRATEAERTELELYRDEQPELVAEVAATREQVQLGAGWLQRIEADNRLQAAHKTPFVTGERMLGAGLVAGGYGLSVFVPGVGTAVAGAGAALLLWSFLRVRIQNLRNDPYRQVKK